MFYFFLENVCKGLALRTDWSTGSGNPYMLSRDSKNKKYNTVEFQWLETCFTVMLPDQNSSYTHRGDYIESEPGWLARLLAGTNFPGPRLVC